MNACTNHHWQWLSLALPGRHMQAAFSFIAFVTVIKF